MTARSVHMLACDGCVGSVLATASLNASSVTSSLCSIFKMYVRAHSTQNAACTRCSAFLERGSTLSLSRQIDSRGVIPVAHTFASSCKVNNKRRVS
eukprot:CAMPEP_0198595026 /NCGR_PEP_ID=MMETSP1462-20131121/141359_1 /TAXON_ID=1333877 /ORGANISM="Brandtodinium nutriculum, Strain RCC3387" /LENGTH=95 /DNA_ID=CAMNT_0044326649 /DNA_START=58 /DNA_END=342 /DNA_ORIENTATION=+